jgi:cysteine synthase B
VELYAKAELANPGGSVKDRPALAMVEDALSRGLLAVGTGEERRPDERRPEERKRILDATSGNTGIALAMIGAAWGLPVTLCLPASASPERHRILRAYGAELVSTSPLEGSDGAIREARRLAAESPGRYAYLDQYGNEENWRAHFRTTGPEIWEQSAGSLTHFVAGLGTSGTLVGVGRYLRQASPGVVIVSVEPEGPLHGLEGMKHMASAIVPPIYDRELADEAWTIPTEEAYKMVKRLARELGLLVGPSSGANVASAVRLAARLDRGVVGTILPDGAEKYLSEKFWESP